MNTPTIQRGIVALAAGTMLFTAACGSDEAADELMLSAEGCDAFAAIGASMFGDPAGLPASIAALSAGASDDLRASVTDYGDALLAALDGDEDAMSSSAFLDADTRIGSTVLASCETATDLSVSGIDFAFAGIPAEVDAGRMAIEFTNETDNAEPHEMLVMKRLDGTDETIGELLDMPEEEFFGKLAPVAVAFADDAGERNVALVDLEPGAYIAVCMIPTAGDGPPHAVKGMVDEFTVV